MKKMIITREEFEIRQKQEAVEMSEDLELKELSFKVLKKGGIIVSMLGKDEKLAGEYGVTAIAQGTKVNTENLNKLTKFIEENDITVHIDKIYDFDKIREPYPVPHAKSPTILSSQSWPLLST